MPQCMHIHHYRETHQYRVPKEVSNKKFAKIEITMGINRVTGKPEVCDAGLIRKASQT
jgi:hypothetical protein